MTAAAGRARSATRSAAGNSLDRKVTHAAMVPTVLQRLLALPEGKTADWSALSYVVYGASPIPPPVLRDATEIIGCSFLQSYRLTTRSSCARLAQTAGDHLCVAH